MGELTAQTKAQLLRAMENEITEHHIYSKLAASTNNEHNASILSEIGNDELRHYGMLKKYTRHDVSPRFFSIVKYILISKLFGLTFGLKLMERGENLAKVNYMEMVSEVPEAEQISGDEQKHEEKLIGLLDEEKLKYVGSIVLGLSDALVELTGALAGFTFALQNARLVAVVGLITGIAASLSMGVSEYLSTKHEDEGEKTPGKAALFTGGAYVISVVFLIVPFFLFSNVFMALGLSLFFAICIIFSFTYYVSVAKDSPLWSRFFEMALICLGVSAISFGIGYLVRTFLGVDI